MSKGKLNIKLLIMVAVASLLIGGLTGGYLQALPASITGGGAMEVIPMNGHTYNLYGRAISSNPATLQFYINGNPISIGQVKNGAWLAQQKATSGLFIFQAVSTLSTIGENDITPPTSVWTNPILPDAGQVTYLNGKGIWDSSGKYDALEYRVKSSAGDLVGYGTTVLRRRSGEYDTAVYDAQGNTDPITGDDTLYKQFEGTFSYGSYHLSMWEYYSNIGKSGVTSTLFSVKQPIQPDTTPPTISSFIASPQEFKSGNLLLKGEYSDSGTGVKSASVKWYNGGLYDFSMIDGEIVVSSDTFRCGETTVYLTVVDGAGNKATRSLIVDKICPKSVKKTPVKNVSIIKKQPTLNVSYGIKTSPLKNQTVTNNSSASSVPPYLRGAKKFVNNAHNLNKLKNKNAFVEFLLGMFGSLGIMLVGYKKIKL